MRAAQGLIPTLARDDHDYPLVMGQRGRSVIGCLEDELNRLSLGGVRRDLQARGERGGGREHDLAGIGSHLLPLPPPHCGRVPVRIGCEPLETARLARTGGWGAAPSNPHPWLM